MPSPVRDALRAFHSAKSRGSRLSSAGASVAGVRSSRPWLVSDAVVREGVHVKVDGAILLIRVTALHERLDERDDLGNVPGRARLGRGGKTPTAA